MWAVWAHRRRIAAYRLSSFGDDESVSFTTCGSRYFGNLAHGRERPGLNVQADVRRFDVKDSTAMCFQLESLILAQNERWRQA